MIIIPARLKSTRFENKILCDIGGLPMFIKTAKQAQNVDKVAIAVDDEKILKIAQDYGFLAILTDKNHQSGTDRINEAAKILNLKNDEIIINLQADEPFFETQNLEKFANFASQKIKNGAFMASAYKKISPEDANEPNLVKVILDNFGDALYFSRAKIPFERTPFNGFLGHIGIYAYSVKNLQEFCSFETSILENTEKLEQLRAISQGKKIAMCQMQTQSIGIDTQDDLKIALKKFIKE